MVCLMDTEKIFVYIQLMGTQLSNRGPSSSFVPLKKGNILLLRVSPETHGGDQTEQCTVGVRPGEWQWIRRLGPFCWTACSGQNRSQKEEIEAVGFERKKETVSISRWHECVHGNPHLQKSIDHHADLTEPRSSELVVTSSDTGAARGQAQVPEEKGSRSSLHELGSPQPWSLFHGCFF